MTGLAKPHFGLSSSFHARNPGGWGGGGYEVTITWGSSWGTRIFQRVITSPSISTVSSRLARQPTLQARPATALRLRDGEATALAPGGAGRGHSARAAQEGPGLREGSSEPCWRPPLPLSAETRRPWRSAAQDSEDPGPAPAYLRQLDSRPTPAPAGSEDQPGKTGLWAP